MLYKGFEMVIGLETHVELKTETKIFCSCSTKFGAVPNTQCCPVCVGLPGALPVLNKKVVDYAIMAGVATNCNITQNSKQDRKNYFYPDLPKSYQTSQFDLPLCTGGWLGIETTKGKKSIGITRIHIEEDAGKLVHDKEKGTMIDCNRCGVPLIEIVSAPDLRSVCEVNSYLQKLRAIILYTGVSDAKMNEGSLRCDVNLSVRPFGAKVLGTRCEMKNLNSFRFIQKAIEYEFKRQVDAVLAGETIVQETRRFDEKTGKTYTMRRKENASDYRQFPCPDLLPIISSDEKISRLTSLIPPLPDERKQKYVEDYGLSSYDSENIICNPQRAEYFERAASHTRYKKQLANMLISDVTESDIKIAPESFAIIVDFLGDAKINSNTAKKTIKEIWGKDISPKEHIDKNNLWQINDENVLSDYIKIAVEANPKASEDYKNGKTAAIKVIIGSVMQKTEGRANPISVKKILFDKFL